MERRIARLMDGNRDVRSAREFRLDNIESIKNDKEYHSIKTYLENEQQELDRVYDSLVKIQQWAIDRGLGGGDGERQLYKLVEEMGELASGIAKGSRDAIIDAIGDMAVVLTVYCTQRTLPIWYGSSWTRKDKLPIGVSRDKLFPRLTLQVGDFMMEHTLHEAKQVNDLFGGLKLIANSYGCTLIDCIDSAYNEIKDRKGKTVNGVFIKEV